MHIGLMALTSIRLEDPTTVRVERRPTDGTKPRTISLRTEGPLTPETLSTPILNALLRLANRWGEALDSELRISDAEFRAEAIALLRRVP